MGVFFMDVETGIMTGYRLRSSGNVSGYTPDGAWIIAWDAGWQLLLRRDTGQSWRWPEKHLEFMTNSDEHLLFAECFSDEEHECHATGRFTIMNHDMEQVAEFSVPSGDGKNWLSNSLFPTDFLFSPDGQMIVVNMDDVIYLVPVASPHPVVLFKPIREGWGINWVNAAPWGEWYEDRGIRIRVYYKRPESDGSDEWEYGNEDFHFSWTGEPLPAPTCLGYLSHDGRYVAQLHGEPILRGSHQPLPPPTNPWPSVVIAEAGTCAPLFRVRSAATNQFLFQQPWFARWLPDGEGFMLRVDGGYAILRVNPEPELVYLPPVPLGASESTLVGPVPAPTGGGRYFAYDTAGVYDRHRNLWILTGLSAAAGYSWQDVWGATHHETRYAFLHDGHGLPSDWFLLPPKIEFPPFDDEIAFRIARTGSCLSLRANPDRDAARLDCLPDGARLALAMPADVQEEPCRRNCYPPIREDSLGSLASAPPRYWVYVRTDNGVEGWVAHEYLDHD